MRIAAIVSCLVAVVACLGCLSIGGRTEVVQHDDRSTTQNGKATLGGNQTLDVYYPVPFGSPPNLEIEGGGAESAIIEQKADHFRIKNTSLLSSTMTWTARGVPTATAPVQIAAPAQGDGTK